ncbi:hypothetical protein DEO72_LG7g1129 [Vigna unguiculata]|uniref:Uncharacterized protein n=1 Tax=Vigna unguiculata TaxID=3917 RepID=A0A4D6MGC5_VIGUN|nr:hypothetical protein DEO72_LG7g1129 [Vigna unguiculata]
MVVKIATQNIRSYESTIFYILSDLAPLKIRDLQGSCRIAVVNRNSAGSGDSGDAATARASHRGNGTNTASQRQQ